MSEQGNDHALSCLIAMRAELAGIVAELEKELDQRRADLRHIDGTLRFMRANLDPTAIPPKRPYRRSRYFTRNELWRLSLNTLRLANGEPLTSEEITLRIMKAKKLDARDESLFAAVRAQVGSVLKRLHRRQVAAPSSKGRGATWQLKSPV
ncbi:MAG: hypothetical protein AB7H90_20270 [Alphaproteobacteria bacterium]